MHIVKHFITITNHRLKVMKYCFKIGLYWQGLIHDLSKYSFIEFFNGAKYYRGIGSPISAERKKQGYSKAWLHHKGRNKHHPEYWIDLDITDYTYKPIPMPDKYIFESFCDHLAASKVYNKKNFEPKLVYEYYYDKERFYMPVHEKTREKFEKLLEIFLEKGEKETFKYMKKALKNKYL